jgi:CDP-6-deoxy-D-xylo-4-hexulose-3-dehydrase
MQAAVGLSQLRRVGDLIAARKSNFAHLWQRLSHLQEFLILPEATPGSDPSWFGFPITLTEAAGVERVDLLRYLDQKKIGTRLLMAGNLVRQPYFAGRQYRISGTLDGADRIMTSCFWVGIYPGLDAERLDYLAEQLEQFFGAGF